jgi:PTH2 family peptidyl-tRNA hydrolase
MHVGSIPTKGIMKQIIIIRKDLKMTRGKVAAQAAHASLGAFLSESKTKQDYIQIPNYWNIESWLENDGQAKIVVGCDSEEELLSLYQQARDADLTHYLVRDAGRTEFDGVPTLTALAIGPNKEEEIDKITGQLKLL